MPVCWILPISTPASSACDTDEYDITGSTEADPLNGRISDESPVGAALLGHSAGDKVEITLPTGAVVLYEVLEVGRADI